MTHDPDRFRGGQRHRFGGIDFRIRPGSKARADYVLDWWTPPGWQPVPLVAVFYVVDFIAWNEDNLYDQPGQLGGEMVLRAIRVARSKGWRRASAQLDEQRARRHDPLAYSANGCAS